jgi:hypothetical protein
MNPFPKYVYKILPSAPPIPLPHALPLSALDTQDGFIHLSTGPQIRHTANLFFSDALTIWLLKIGSEQVEAEGGELRWAEGRPGCVHLYSKEEGQWMRLGNGVIQDVMVYGRQVEQDWGQALVDASWDLE